MHVSVDSVEKNAAFCEKEGLDFFMPTDVVSNYCVSYPILFLFDPSKNVRWVVVDVENHIWRHSEKVLDKLRGSCRVFRLQ